jgi:peroxiredoxin
MMNRRNLRCVACGIVAGAVLALGNGAGGEEPKADSLAAIDAQFDRDTRELEKVRLQRIGALAASKTGAEADALYDAYFRLAITGNLYDEAEKTAETMLKSPDASASVAMLAHLVNIIAEANRGEFPESLSDLDAAVKASKERKSAPLPTALKLTLVDAYLQRLVQGGQFEIARQALKLVNDHADDPAVKALASQWQGQVALVGKPAPPIAGKDVDGKPVNLADAKGDVVLVVFWATWCVANAQEVAALEEAYKSYHGKGLRIIGVNLDSHQDGGRPAADVVSDVKRFLIDFNIRWPNLIDSPDSGDLAKAYGVKDIPSNVLIGRDGTVIQFNLTRANLDKVLAGALAR